MARQNSVCGFCILENIVIHMVFAGVALIAHLGQIQGCRFSTVVVIPVHVKNLCVHKVQRKIMASELCIVTFVKREMIA